MVFPPYPSPLRHVRRTQQVDRVVCRWTLHGTDLGGLGDLPPTGRHATMQGIYLERLEKRRIVESWCTSDHTPMLEAPGLIEDALPRPQKPYRR